VVTVSHYTVVISGAARATEYLLPVGEINLEARAPLTLTRIIWHTWGV